jgi:uncharacterized membrane protein YraQ (UPF0718 family)
VTRILSRAGAVLFSAIATLALLVAVAAAARGLPDRVAGYLAVTIVAAAIVAVLMRSDVRRRRAEDALLPAEQRPVRRAPRRPISFPLLETGVTFTFWYAAAVAVEIAVTGTTSAFTLAAIAPFAAFMLTTLTIAGRHMAFRLTAEEAADDEGPSSPRRADPGVGAPVREARAAASRSSTAAEQGAPPRARSD